MALYFQIVTMAAPVILELPTEPSLLLQAEFISLSLLMAAFVGWWSKRPLIIAGWVLFTAALALGGVLKMITVPPPFIGLVFGGLIAVVLWHRRGNWRPLSLKVLVGFQAFRVLVEFFIHDAVVEGVAPEQLTWTGLNFDIVTGIAAALLFPFVDRVPTWVLRAFNIVGAALLINVVTVAILSLPLPIQQFEPVNAWVGFFPFNWLPLILVLTAALGHFALAARLKEARRSAPSPS